MWDVPPTRIHRGWRCRFAIGDLLDTDETDPATVARIARTLHERLEAFRAERFPNDDTLAEVSDEFHTIGFVDGDENARCNEFNAVLSDLYDWADETRVWIEGEA